MKLPALLAEIERLDREATAGPWEHDHDVSDCWDVSVKDHPLIVAELCNEPNATLIATYRNSTPKIARALRHAMEALEDIQNYSRSPDADDTSYRLAREVLAAIRSEVEG